MVAASRWGFGRRYHTAAPCVVDGTLRNAFDHVAFIEGVFAFTEFCFDGIPTDVAHAVREVILIAHKAIKVIFLPEGAAPAEKLVDAHGAVTFPTGHDLLQLPRSFQGGAV